MYNSEYYQTLLSQNRTMRTKKNKTYKYSFSCSRENLLELLNSGNWNNTNNINGFLENTEINFKSKEPIKKGSFTQSIFDDNHRLINFNVDDKIQIWSKLKKTRTGHKRTHASCVIWVNGIPHSFGFAYSIYNNNELVVSSPDDDLELALIRQMRYNPSYSKNKRRYVELLSMGSLTELMIYNIEVMMNIDDTRKVNDKFIEGNIIMEGFEPMNDNFLSFDNFIISKSSVDFIRLKQFKEKFKRANVKPLIIYPKQVFLEDKKYCKYNTSRSKSGSNCFSTLDTLFKEIFSCRIFGTLSIPSRCRSKTPCDQYSNSSYTTTGSRTKTRKKKKRY